MARFRFSIRGLTVAALTGFAGCAPALSTALPGADGSRAEPFANEPAAVGRVTTGDGATLGLKRYAAEATPVVLIHGLALNAESWDCPPADGPGYVYRSLASTLRDAGFDVWLLNLRGHGNGESRSRPPPGQVDWSIDHFALYDVPAAVEHVAGTTGRRPFVIASSLGAMALAGWLQGAVQHDDAAAYPSGAAHGLGPRIVADAVLGAERQSLLAGAVFVAFPAALRWPQSPVDEADRVVWGSLLAGLFSGTNDANVVFESAAYSPGLQGALDVYGSLPLRLLRPNAALEAWEDRLPPPLARLLDDVDKALFALGADFVGTFNGRSPGRLDVVLAARRTVLEDVEAGVLRQFGRSIRAGAFISDLGEPPHVYSDHYANLALPTLLILGGRDRNANADVCRTAFFDRISSADKTLLLLESLAHGEFELAPVATRLVYPEIVDWLTARDTAP